MRKMMCLTSFAAAGLFASYANAQSFESAAFDGRILGKWESSKTIGSAVYSEKIELSEHKMSEVLTCQSFGNPFSGSGKMTESKVSTDTPVNLKNNTISILEDRSSSNSPGATPCELQRPKGAVVDFTVENDTLTIGSGENALVFQKVKSDK